MVLPTLKQHKWWWMIGFAPRKIYSSNREGKRRNLLIGVGDDSTIVGFCLVPDRACWIRATA